MPSDIKRNGTSWKSSIKCHQNLSKYYVYIVNKGALLSSRNDLPLDDTLSFGALVLSVQYFSWSNVLSFGPVCSDQLKMSFPWAIKNTIRAVLCSHFSADPAKPGVALQIAWWLIRSLGLYYEHSLAAFFLKQYQPKPTC